MEIQIESSQNRPILPMLWNIWMTRTLDLCLVPYSNLAEFLLVSAFPFVNCLILDGIIYQNMPVAFSCICINYV